MFRCAHLSIRHQPGFPIEHVRLAHVHSALLHAVVGTHGGRCVTRACRVRMNAVGCGVMCACLHMWPRGSRKTKTVRLTISIFHGSGAGLIYPDWICEERNRAPPRAASHGESPSRRCNAAASTGRASWPAPTSAHASEMATGKEERQHARRSPGTIADYSR